MGRLYSGKRKPYLPLCVGANKLGVGPRIKEAVSLSITSDHQGQPLEKLVFSILDYSATRLQ